MASCGWSIAQLWTGGTCGVHAAAGCEKKRRRGRRHAVGFSFPLPLNASLFDIGWFRLVRGNRTSRLGLSSVYTTTTNAAGVTFHFATPASANAEMYLWIVKGLSHQYANGTNYPLKYADVFWDFFAKHSR